MALFIILFYCFFALPYATGVPPILSQTGINSSENRLYVPQYPLWTDGAVKTRWIYLPQSSQINTENADQWIFPVGTKLWKQFSFKNTGKLKRVETRLMEKTGEGEWQFASYLWNEQETEAVLAPEDGVKNYYKTSENTFHDIPSTTNCARCHRRGGDALLGFDAIQLSLDTSSVSP